MVKSRPHHDAAHLHPQPMSLPSVNFYTLRFLRYNQDKIFKLRVTMARSKVKSRSHNDIVHLHLQSMSQQSINFLHLTVSEIQPRHTFSDHLPDHLDTMVENNIPKALKGCGVKTSYCFQYFGARIFQEFNK